MKLSTTVKWLSPFTFSAVLLLFILFFSHNNNQTVQASGLATCGSSADPTATYTVTLCLTAPADGTVIAGTAPVTATIEVEGVNPLVKRIVFYHDNNYLLTDFQAPYTFMLPSDHFVDGTIPLSVEALMRDGFVTDRVTITVTYNNGNIVPPTNTNSFSPHSGSATPGQSYVVAATGDGASGKTPEVPAMIASWNPDMFIYTGDVYERGTFTEFINWYGSNGSYFHQFYNISNPIVGDHEYLADGSGQAPGYFYYWDNAPNYYSYTAGDWDVFNLNSSGTFGQILPTSPQYIWLQNQLASSTNPCTLVVYHNPRYSVGPKGDNPQVDAIWDLLVQEGVDIVLNGDEHSYQRWHPLDEDGLIDAQGVTQFIVGTGGHSIQGFVTTDSRLAAGEDATPQGIGALRLGLNAVGVEFEYLNIAGTLVDSGVVPCTGAPTDTQSPATPILSGTVTAGGLPALNWSKVYDNAGVQSYQLYRNGTFLKTTPGLITNTLDYGVELNTTYTYTVQAEDSAGNFSAHSNVITITTPNRVTLQFTPVADSYTDETESASNFGTGIAIRVDGLPEQDSYLRFNIENLLSTITNASLHLYANSASSTGFGVYRVSDNSWLETGITYDNAPVFADFINNSGAFVVNSWQKIEVTPVITQDGLISFGLLTGDVTSIHLSSREGANPPYLSIDLAGDCSAEDAGMVLNAGSTIEFSWTGSISDVYRAVDQPYFADGQRIGNDVSSGFTFVESLVGNANSHAFFMVGDAVGCGKRFGEFDFAIVPGS